jgi:hypothetical protein
VAKEFAEKLQSEIKYSVLKYFVAKQKALCYTIVTIFV